MLVHRSQVERSDPAQELAGIQPDGPARFLGSVHDAAHDGFVYDLTIANGRRLWLYLPAAGRDGARLAESPIASGGAVQGPADIRFAVRSPDAGSRLPEAPFTDAEWAAWAAGQRDATYPTRVTIEAWAQGFDSLETFAKYVRPSDGGLAAVRTTLDLRWVRRSHLDVGARAALYPFAVAGDALLVVTVVVVAVVLSPAGL